MQEAGLNGHPEHHDYNQTDDDDVQEPALTTNGLSDHNDNRGSPSRKRKVAELPRPESPPWKRASADGPASFVQNGRRKSGRTNVVPLELQPQSAKRQTRAAFDKAVGDHQKHAKPQYKLTHRKSVDAPPKQLEQPTKRGPGRPPKVKMEVKTPLKGEARKEQRPNSRSPTLSKIALLERKLALLKEEKRLARRRRHSEAISPDEDSDEMQPDSGVTDNESEVEISLPEAQQSPSLTLHKVTFRVGLPKPTIATPHNVAMPRKFSSFEEFLEKDETEFKLGQDLLSSGQVRKEALMRRKVREAQKPGGFLATRRPDGSIARQLEPRQFAHRDHLLSHVSYFRKLMAEEHRAHKQRATIIAHEAKRYVENKARRNRVKTKEEIELEEWARTQAVYKAVVKDIDKLWAAVLAEVVSMRQKEYEEQQQAKMKDHLARVLDRTDQMLNQDADDSMLNSEGVTDGSDDSDAASEDSEQMSQSGSESSSGTEQDDGDAQMSLDELRRKYAQMPDLERSSVEPTLDMSSKAASTAPETEEDSDPDIEMDSEFDVEDDEDAGEAEDSQSESETEGGLASLLYSKEQIADMTLESDVQDTPGEDTPANDVGSPQISSPAAMDDGEEDSDPDIEMDSEFDTDGDDDGTKTETDESDAGLPLLLFSKGELSQLSRRAESDLESEILGGMSQSSSPLVEEMEETHPKPRDLEETTASFDDIDHDMHTIDDVPKAEALSEQSAEIVGEAHLVDDTRPSSIGQISQDPSTQASPRTTTTKATESESVSSPEPHVDNVESPSAIKTPVPKLLRGTLREYQHEGLDWLANLYANDRSGILADEMGLGKTIQSIALLAHLAETHQVWGPHLIVVPTSVMLNWEVEFKKFLPGFKILTYYGSPEERKQKRRGWMADDVFNVCITSYQLVLQDANSFKRRKWHYMILDEAHNIKNFRSERWQTMMTFNTKARLLLTGTPLQNNLTELWSLLFFLHYGQETDDDDDAFAGLQEWSQWFKRPVESILEQNKQELDAEDKEQVAKLHKVIRPFLLRRLKADVEKQMPLKYEHVELCRLSKRQRQLYDGFMSRAQTKETLASGNYLSIINALMQLRKVCNHPDLFETRPINTSFAMPKSVAAEFEIHDLLVRRRLLEGVDNLVDLDFIQLVPICNERRSMIEFHETTRRHAFHQIKALRDQQLRRVKPDKTWNGEQSRDVLVSLEGVARQNRLQDLDRTMYFEAYRHHEHPMYGRALFEKLTLNTTYQKLSRLSGHKTMTRFWGKDEPMSGLSLVQSTSTRSQQMQPYVEKFGCITPAAITNDMSMVTVSEAGAAALRQSQEGKPDPFHEAQMKLSIAFPDKRLLQYDCGKLQRLDKLLRKLQTGGHRALIFTQMTKVLDILEQFLNIHGHRYLRLDGATKIEQRQMLTERFNNDNKILAFILSSRSGGLGINLTGADTVIFYDLDWNPAMDKQCTDRAHRIGQTRDVHIYRFVSEHTIESNILRKANQKQMLDDVVIQEGDFTTEYLNKLSYRDMLDEEVEEDVAGAAMDRVLGNDKHNAAVFEQAEDKEDIAAAKVAAREVQHADDGDFEDKAMETPRNAEAQTLGPSGATNAALAEADSQDGGHIDEYMLKLHKFLLRDVPLGPLKERKKKGKRRDEHRTRRVR